MKTLLIALSLLVGSAQAAEVEVQLLQMTRLADDNVYQVGNWQGIQLNYKFEKAYVFASHETAQIIPLWGIGDMSLTGFGAGMEYEITPKLSLFGQLGYYLISHENEGRHSMDMRGPGASEGMWMYMNHQFAYLGGESLRFDEHYINYENALGGTIGLEFTQPISKNADMGFVLSYRSLKIPETLRVMKDEWNFDETGKCWEQEITRNYSSLNFGITFGLEF